MTDVRPSAEISADEADAHAARWLERQDREGWSQVDQIEFDEWIGQSLAHRVSYWRLKAAWGRTGRLSALRTARTLESSARKRFWTILTRSAAVLGTAAIVATTVYLYPKEDEWTYSTPVGGHETVRLGDGSQIELNTDTVIRVATDANQRKVLLVKGEAYFQIRHDADHPFIVTAGEHRIVDLGTKFVVRSDPGRLEVSLVEGRARFETTAGAVQSRATVLSPGDVVVATADSVSFAKKSTPALNAALSWRRDVLVFNHTALSAAADEFNRYNREKLVIADRLAARRTIGGTFPKNGLTDFAEVARAMLGLKVSKNGSEIVISR